MWSAKRIRRGMVAVALALTPLQAGPGVASPMGPGDANPPGEILLVDRLIVHGSLLGQVQKELEPMHSMEAVMDVLRRHGIRFERDDTRLPASVFPPDLLKAIDSLPGEPFVVPTDADKNGWMVGVVKGRVPAE